MQPVEGQPVCVIGAGSSGIAAAKVLKDHGVGFDCFELSDRVGGNWAYGNPNGMSAAYRSLFINTSKWLMEYSDFPMGEDLPAYPHHTHIAAYFNEYVDHFGIREHIRFQTGVTSVEPDGSGWRVELGDGSTGRYSAVMVANGHHWAEKWPEFPGRFDGEVMHAHGYRTPEGFEGKNVVVVGIGNSGVDIASELSRVAANVWSSTRRGAHVIPKFIGGKPLDRINSEGVNRMLSHLPLWVTRRMYERLLKKQQGEMADWGLPEPDHRLLHAHPTISAEYLPLVQHGRIKVRPDITELRGDRVAFADGSEEPVDVIVYATGYRIRFPFLSDELIDTSGNQVRLYRHVAHPLRAGLYFIGLVQPLGAIMPLAEMQAIWIAQVIRGEIGLPRSQVMEREIDRDLAGMAKRYVASTRHTIQVDHYAYMSQLRREIKRGRRYRDSDRRDNPAPGRLRESAA